MEINRLRQFCTIHQTGNLRRAAELLRVSPGALSKAIKQLERELNQKLLIQVGRGIAISDEGQRLFKFAQRVISEHDHMFEAMSQQGKVEQGPIRLASFELFTTYFLGAMISEDFTESNFRVVERGPGQIEDAILNRDADFGITTIPVPHPEIDFLSIAKFRRGVFARVGAFKGVQSIQVPFSAPVTAVSATPNGATNLDGWPHDIPRKVKYHFELLETGLEVCRLGLAAIYCPDFIISLQNIKLRPEYQLKPLHFEPRLPLINGTIYLVKRRTDPETQEMKKLSRAVRLICK